MKSFNIGQLFFRVALAAGFLSAVADRFGIWGEPGSKLVAWGNWENFVAYSNTLNAYVPAKAGEIMAIAATVLEAAFGILLLVGYKTRMAAYGSGLLLLAFALTMSFSLGAKSALDYGVWAMAGGCFLLASVEKYRYSVDQLLIKS